MQWRCIPEPESGTVLASVVRIWARTPVASVVFIVPAGAKGTWGLAGVAQDSGMPNTHAGPGSVPVGDMYNPRDMLSNTSALIVVRMDWTAVANLLLADMLELRSSRTNIAAGVCCAA